MNSLQHNDFSTCANCKFAGREYAPFSQEGGLGKVYQLFVDDLKNILDELNEALAT